MKNVKIYLLILLNVFLIISCNEKSETVKNTTVVSNEKVYDLNKFNDLSTFFHLDSINQNEDKIHFFFTDTSKFYQPERHVQNYVLSLLFVVNHKESKFKNASVSYDVKMPYRKDGNVSNSYRMKDLIPTLDQYSIPTIKEKILLLNKLNRKKFIDSKGKETTDLLYKLNMYFAQKIKPGAWIGLDSHDVIMEYELKKANGLDLENHLDLFNSILTDTSYMRDKTVGKEIHQILIK